MQTHGSITTTQFQVQAFFYRVGFWYFNPYSKFNSLLFNPKFPSISISPTIDPFQANTSHTNEPPLKKPKRSYDKSRVFQDTWAMQFPWA
jgi:hypothetical protein